MIIRLSFFLSLILITLSACGPSDLTVWIESTPQNTPPEDTLFLAGNFNGWQAASQDFAFQPIGEGQYMLDIPVPDRTVQFKVTRGTWDKVETQADGSPLPNRELDRSALGADTLRIRIANWQDQVEGAGQSTACEHVHILTDSFYFPSLDRYRRIWVYLPPGYDSSGRRYPVLYLHDGQNVFDNLTSYSGEWKVDEALDSIFYRTEKGFIAVGIDHGGDHRMQEYTPWKNRRIGDPEGKAYLEDLVGHLKPFIDTTFRTLTGPTNTGIMGSSMGGLISMYAIGAYPDVFGKAGVFSPSFWVSGEAYRQFEQLDAGTPVKIFLLVGQREGIFMVKNTRKMYRLLQQEGFPEAATRYLSLPDGAHNEAFWAREFPGAMDWLFDN